MITKTTLISVTKEQTTTPAYIVRYIKGYSFRRITFNSVMDAFNFCEKIVRAKHDEIVLSFSN